MSGTPNPIPNNVATRGGKVALQNKSGEIGFVDATKANEYLSEGYLPVSSQEMAKSEQRAQDESLGGMARTAALNLTEGAATITAGAGRAIDILGNAKYSPGALIARGLGFDRHPGAIGGQQAAIGGRNEQGQAQDLSQDATSKLGLTTPEEMERLGQANPGTAAVSRLAGETIPMVAMGATLPEFAAATRWGKVAASAGRGAVELGGYGAAAEARDPEADAEHILAAGAFSGILGGATMGALGSAGLGLRRVFGRLPTSELGAEVAERIGTEEAEAATNPAWKAKAREWEINRMHRMSGAPKDLLEEVGPGGPRSIEAQHASVNLDSMIDESALKLRPVVNDAQKAIDEVTSIVRNRGFKTDEISKLGGSEFNTEARRAAGKLFVQDAANGVEDIIGETPIDLLGGKVRKQIYALHRELGGLAQSASESKTAADSYILADQAKRRMQQVVHEWGKDLQNLVTSGRITSAEAAQLRSSQTAIEEIQERIRTGLMDKGIWGDKVAAAQREVNEVFSEGGIKSLRQFEKHFMTDSGETNYGGLNGNRINVLESDPGKLAGSMRSLGTAEGNLREEAIDNYSKMAKKLVETIGDKYGLVGKDAEAVKRAINGLDSIANEFKAIRDQQALASDWNKLQGYTSPFAGKDPGIVKKLLFQPGATAEMWNHLVEAREHVQHMLGGTESWIAGGAKAEAKATGGSGKLGKLVGYGAAMAAFRGTHANDRDAYESRVKAVLAASPEKLGPHTEGLSPEIQLATGAKMSAGVEFLKSQIPPSAQVALMQPTKKIFPNEYDRTQFGKAWATVTNPETALKDLRAGRMSPVQAKALQAVYPSLYNDLRLSVMRGIGKADAAGHSLPIYQRQQLDLLLDLGGAGEPAFAPEFASKVRQGLAMQFQKRQATAPSRKQPQSSGLVSPVMRGLGVS